MRSSPFEKVGRLRPGPQRAVKQIQRDVAAANIEFEAETKGGTIGKTARTALLSMLSHRGRETSEDASL
ncbi:MAG: hypothetical protein C0483_02135 [Pirellula sp.]|nr:hypothetical protein [Pirellula sp.]